MMRRSFPRIRLNIDVTIVTHAGNFPGILKNISLSGLFVRTKVPTKVGEATRISLPLTKVSRQAGIEFKGVAVRVEADGIAYRISNIDHTNFSHLKAVLANKNVRKLAA